MEGNKSLPQFSKGEEIFNAVTHIVGGGLSVCALILTIIFASRINGIAVFSAIIYSLSTLIMFVFSSIYHFLRPNRAKKVFRILDHCSIFLTIAGTYTPFCLISLHGTWYGYAILGFVWLLAILGIVFNSINMHSKVVIIFSQTCYILMGWCILLAVVPLIEAIGLMGFILMVIGGLMFTFGTIFFAFGKKVKYFHSIWHLFVLLGCLFMFFSIILFVL